MSYHVGVAQGLLDAGMITPEVPLAGASGGALAAFCAALQPSPPGGVTTDVLFRAVLEANGKCRAKGAFRNLREFLDEALDDLFAAEEYCEFDENGNELSCEAVQILNTRPASLRVGVTQLAPLPRGLLVDSWRSLADLKQSLIASCCIPFW